MWAVVDNQVAQAVVRAVNARQLRTALDSEVLDGTAIAFDASQIRHVLH